MRHVLPGSVLFCCNYNAVRSPVAEGLMKARYGQSVYVQSAGVRHEIEIDPFMVEAAREIGIELSRHRVKSFEEMEEWGDDIGAYDLIVALSPAAQRRALEYTRLNSVEVVYWPTLDPTGMSENRAALMDAYRQTRDQIAMAIRGSFPPP